MSAIKGSGNKATETREVSGFDGIDMAGVGNLIVRQTGSTSLTVEGDDNIVPLIVTEVVNGKLVIRVQEKSNINPKTPLVYNVTVSDLNSLGLSGAGNVEASDIKARNFSTSISGAGHVVIGNLAADSLELSLPGAGDVTLSGNVGTQKVSISGAGRYKADDLKSETANVTTSGVGSATVWVTGTLNASISGVGSIQFYGSPAVVSHASGMGSISRMGDKWARAELPEYGG